MIDNLIEGLTILRKYSDGNCRVQAYDDLICVKGPFREMDRADVERLAELKWTRAIVGDCWYFDA